MEEGVGRFWPVFYTLIPELSHFEEGKSTQTSVSQVWMKLETT